MKLKEFRNEVNESEYSDFFKNCSVLINYPHINYKVELKGLSSIYNFTLRHTNKWTTDDLPTILNNSKEHFKRIKSSILTLLNDASEYNVKSKWNSIKSQLQLSVTNNRTKIFTFDSSESDFLLKLHKENPNYVIGAYNFLCDINFSFSNIQQITGALRAYEFKFQEHSALIKRRQNERSTINSIRNDFEKYISNTESQFIEIIKNSNEQLSEHTSDIDKLIISKDTKFEKWHNKVSDDFDVFYKKANKEITNNEKLYREKLKLEAPAQYWNKRADKLKVEGESFLKWLVGLVLLGSLSLYLLLWQIPDGIFLDIFKGNASAIKWSIIYITFLSFIAYGIRILAKLTFSSFHLSRDAQEREQLTYVYLALKKDQDVTESERQLILQSLFSRADTGLLKDDSSPSMPSNGIIEKIHQ